MSRPVVSVLVELGDGSERVLLQRRSKEWAGRYRGLLELPQGHLETGESMIECAARELREETGLYDFTPKAVVSHENVLGESLASVESLVVTEVGDQAFMAVCIVGAASGEPQASRESSDPRWYDGGEVLSLIADDAIFPLNVPMLEWYFSV